MPLDSYGVLKARVLDRRLATDRSDHYQLLCGVGTTRRRVAINAHSDDPPSEVAHATVTPFEHAVVASLEQLREGWRVLKSKDGLDYIRGGLCEPEQFRPLPPRALIQRPTCRSRRSPKSSRRCCASPTRP